MITIKTKVLKEMTTKAIKGAGFSNVIVLTSMIGIKVSDNKLRLITTDINSTMSVITNDIEGDLDITVNADIFSKLISKLTSEEIKLDVEDNVLYIEANGKYKIPIIVDENGTVSLDEPDIIEGEENEVKLSDIKSIKDFSKISLDESLEDLDDDYMSSYYCDLQDTTITNGFVATFNKKSITKDIPLLVPTKVIDLVCLSSDENIKLIKSNNCLQFVSSDVIITLNSLNDTEDYPIDSLKSILNEEFKYDGKINCKDYINAIDRLKLFIDPYDDNELEFNFYTHFIEIKSKNNSSTEELKLDVENDNENYLQFSCSVNASEFIRALSSIPNKDAHIYYGNDSVIKIDCGNMIHIISLSQDDEVEEQL